MRYLVYDIETGGSDPEYSILTFYAVVLDEKLAELDSISLKIKHEKYIVQPAALKINGINLVEHDSIAEKIDKCREKLEQFLLLNTSYGKEKLVNTGHNIFWDLNFVKKTLFPEIDSYVTKHSLDTGTLALILKSIKKLPPDFEISLKNLSEYYNVKSNTYHEARADVLTTVAVLKCMLSEIKEKK